MKGKRNVVIEGNEGNRKADDPEQYELKHLKPDGTSQALKTLVTTTARGDDFFDNLVKAVAQTLELRWVLVGRLNQTDRVDVVAAFGGDLQNYGLGGTPCQEVMKQDTCFYPENVAELFPDDSFLREVGAQAYLGAPLRSRDGKNLGILVALHDQAIAHDDFKHWLFEAFAQRAASELETLDNRSRLEATAQAQGALRGIQTAKELYWFTLHAVLEFTQASNAMLTIYSEPSDSLRVVAAIGPEAESLLGEELKRGSHLAWRAFEAEEPVYLANVGHDGSSGPPDDGVSGDFMAAPLLSAEGRLIGILSLDTWRHEHRRELSSLDRYYLEALAQAAGTASSRLETLERAKYDATRFRSLVELSTKLEILSKPLDIAKEALRTLLPLSDFALGALFLKDGDAIRLQLMEGDYDETLHRLFGARQVRIGEGLLGQALFQRRTIHVLDYSTWSGGIECLQGSGLKTAVAAPLFLKGESYGALMMADYFKLESVPRETVALLETVAHRVERAFERTTYLQELEATREASLRAMGLALEYRDYETKGHTDRVTALAADLGDAASLSREDMRHLRWGSYLHDSGKIAIPDPILLKPGKLDAEEWATMKNHVIIGETMVRELGFIPEQVLQLVRSHHERWDGGGYPDGLGGKDIPLLARIFSLVDVYDALTSERPYKSAWSHEAALTEIRVQEGKQFDPELTRVFLSLWT